VVHVGVKEALPAAQPVDRDVDWQITRLDGIGELVEVEHALVPPVHRHHEVDVQVTDDDVAAIVGDVQQVDVPGCLLRAVGVNAGGQPAVVGHHELPGRER
jgi:hypothetical protein